MSVVPRVSLGELCTIQIGRTPPRDEPRYWGPGHPWLAIADMSQGRDLLTTKETITEAAVNERNCRPVSMGTVVLSFKLSVGKVGLVRREMFTNEAIAALPIRDATRLDAGYLLHALMALDFRNLGERAVKGITLNAGSVAQLQIPVPPASEQRRIATILDKADSVQRKQRERMRLLDEFLRSAFLEMFGDPVRNEKCWQMARLGELALFVGGGTPSRAIPEFFTGPIPWASSKDITTENLLDTQEHVTPEAVGQSATRIVSPGSILVVVKSKILLRRLPVAIARTAVCFSQDIKGIEMRDDRLSVSYLARHLRVGQQALLNKARGANTEGLTLDHLRDYRVMLPPADLLARWERVETAIRALRGSFNEHRATGAALFGALAERAFGTQSSPA